MRPPELAWRRGVTPAEVLTVIVVLTFLGLIALMALPRQRENARTAGCRRNLMQIGLALALYERSEAVLPTNPPFEAGRIAGSSPLKALLETLALPDLTELSKGGPAAKPRSTAPPGERPVPGFVCFSDPNATTGLLIAPVSYRGCAGDQPDGGNGGFAPGKVRRLADVEEGDGRAFTVAFAERLLGTGRDDDRSASNYAEVKGPVSGSGCRPAPGGRWRGDAGSSWVSPGWRSTAYNHTLTPNATPSCVSDDSRTAAMGASSGHVGGVNLLMFDGSVRTVSPTVAPAVWRGMATVSSPPTSTPNVLKN